MLSDRDRDFLIRVAALPEYQSRFAPAPDNSEPANDDQDDADVAMDDCIYQARFLLFDEVKRIADEIHG